MSDETIKGIQRTLAKAGVYEGSIDGIWGGMSQGALDTLVAFFSRRNEVEQAPVPNDVHYLNLAWGAKVSQKFKDRVLWICRELKLDPNYLMACIAWESAETFAPDVKNMAGSGATGLIQFMPKTARGLGTNTGQLAKMTAEDQLNYVYKYFAPFKGRLISLSDVYMAILWPVAVGKAEDYVLWEQSKKPTTYRQNMGLDANRDGKITKSEAASKILAMLNKGLLPENRG